MSNLISGKEALIALANGAEVEVHESTYKKDVWFDLVKTNFNVEEILKGKVDNKPYTLEFRLKLPFITLNGIEVPAPFEPKEGDVYWMTCTSNKKGYGHNTYESQDNDSEWIQFGAWRTEEEIKQVAEALRSIFK